jgi:hypothetical protein
VATVWTPRPLQQQRCLSVHCACGTVVVSSLPTGTVKHLIKHGGVCIPTLVAQRSFSTHSPMELKLGRVARQEIARVTMTSKIRMYYSHRWGVGNGLTRAQCLPQHGGHENAVGGFSGCASRSSHNCLTRRTRHSGCAQTGKAAQPARMLRSGAQQATFNMSTAL